VLGVGRGAVRLGRVSGESEREKSEHVAIGGLDVSVGLDRGLYFI
jgi:hypothetical protein